MGIYPRIFDFALFKQEEIAFGTFELKIVSPTRNSQNLPTITFTHQTTGNTMSAGVMSSLMLIWNFIQ